MTKWIVWLMLGLLTTLFYGQVAYGQLCNGSLGDPVVNITFGSGNNYGSQLGNNITNYNYSTAPCFNDGQYILANSMPSCFNNTWYSLAEDHTPGDANGYMMVINASNNPGDFYVKTVAGLCGGVTYEFAGWIMNILKPQACGGGGIKPNVTFRIETLSGTVLLSYNTGDINPSSAATWRQYGAFFTLPTGLSDVVIRMTNNSSGGCGNDLVLDDITFRPCGKLVNISLPGGTTTQSFCAGSPWSLLITSDAVAGSNTVYQWQQKTDADTTWSDIPGATALSYSPPFTTNPGNYFYRLSFGQSNGIGTPSCRIVSNEVKIILNALPVAAPRNNGPLCEGEQLIIWAADGFTYSWSGPQSFTSTRQTDTLVNIAKANEGKYLIKVVSSAGCVGYDSINVSINKNPSVNIVSGPASLCQGDEVNLSATGNNASSYQWTPANGLSADNILSPAAKPLQTTLYKLVAANANCTQSDSVLLTVFTKPVANAGPDLSTIEGVPIILSGSATGGLNVQWTPPYYLNNTTTLQPLATPLVDTTYTLTVISTNGCGQSIDMVNVKVYRNIDIPNVFSPNGDGVNDTWQIKNLITYQSATLQVFNRYGQVVFNSYGRYQPWDGKYNNHYLPTGTYYFLIHLPGIERDYTGWVTLLR